MAHLYHFFNRSLFTVIVMAGMLSPAIAQVGFNNPNPDTTALIDMKATDKGLLVPRMTTIDRTNMTLNGKKPANALLVFDTDLKMFFFYDTVTVPNRWLAMNPWVSQGTNSSDINTSTNGNVGIGTTSAPTAKLEVNGAIKANGNITSSGNVSATSATVSGNVTTGPLNSTGTVTATKFVGDGIIPQGGIIMWSGTTPPPGWALCDGTNGRPDLKGRFVIGAGTYSEPSGTYTYTVGGSGGETKHALTVSEMPKHTHSVFMLTYFGPNGTGGGDIVGGNGGSGGVFRFDNKDSKFTGGDGNQSAGNGLYHENRPPYYVLAYIIKL